MRELETIRLMEDEIQNIINQNKNDSDFKNEDDKEIFLFKYFYEEDSIGNKLALEWFNKKGCEVFCNGMINILNFIKIHWKREFGEDFCDILLSPHDMIKTYVYCKAKDLINN